VPDDVDVREVTRSNVGAPARARQRAFARSHQAVVAVVSLGGGVGAVARYGLSQLLPTLPGQFPWATFLTNVLGCFLIGVLTVLVTEVLPAHRLLRPFLGVGVLGGFTTFSTYAVEVLGLLRPGSVPLAFAYLAGTVICALLAAILGVGLTRWATGALHHRRKGV
jgi:CrcB protein